MFHGVPIERLAFDVLQSEERSTSSVDARVVEAGDTRMLERRQDVALAIEAFREPAIEPGDPRQLERHLTLQRAIGSLRQPDRRCSSGAEFANEAIGPNPVAAGKLREAAVRYRPWQQYLQGLGHAIPAQQLPKGRRQSADVRRQRIDPLQP